MTFSDTATVLHEAKLARRHQRHAQEQSTVPEPRDVRRAIDTFLVVHGYVANAQVEARRTEQQVEVTEWVEVPEV